MVKVLTENGIFEITNDLYEAIKNNNPEILEEKVFLKKDKIKDNKNKKIIKKVEKIINSKLNRTKAYEILNNKDIKKLSDDEISQLLIRQASSKPEMANLSSSISDDASEKVIQDEQPKTDIQTVDNPSDNQSDNPSDKQSNIDNEKNNNQNGSNNDNDGEISLMEDFIKNGKLKEEIIDCESVAITLVKYIKSIERSRIGSYGSDIQPEKSFTSSNLKKAYDKDPENSKNFRDYLKKNKITSSELMQANKYKKSDIADKTKAASKFLMGGFIFRPISPNDDEYTGLSLRFLGEAVQNNNSEIAKMIHVMYKIKNNTTNNIVDIDQNKEKFERMVVKYLTNVCYKLTINSSEDFYRMIQVMRYDPKIRARFDIREMNDIRFMDAKRTIMLFINKNDNNPSLLLIVEPVLARTKEFLKGFSPLVNKLKNLKG